MATARALDCYEDPGMAFTEQEVMNYSTVREAEDRLVWLIELQNVMAAYEKISAVGHAGARVWSQRAAKDLKRHAGYLCVAAGIPAPDDSDFDTEDKEFNLRAQQVEDPREWVEALIAETEGVLRRLVTLGRRAKVMQSWNKTERSVSNKFLNAVQNDKRRMELWQEELRKYKFRES
jgi:hypothetical protein